MGLFGSTVFANRTEAGRLLAEHLVKLAATAAPTVVLAVPRGGAVVAEPVARALGAPLDVIVPRKLGAPGNPELAVGALAVAGGEDIVLLDDDSIRYLGVTPSYLDAEVARQRREIERREEAYRGGRAPAPLEGRRAILVDDGIATGLTMRAAAEAVRRAGPAEVLVAVPVAPPETAREFAARGLRLEALATPSPFRAVGHFYQDFAPVEDDEVKEILRRAASA